MDAPQNASHFRPASPEMELSWRSRRLPEPEPLAENMWVVAFPTETDFVGYTLSYIVRDEREDFHIIDPGWDNRENQLRLERFLGSVGGSLKDVASTLVSHFHPDHFGMAEFLRKSSGAEITLSEREQCAIDGPQRVEDPLAEWGVPIHRRFELRSLDQQEYTLGPIHADRRVHDGDVVGGPGAELRVMATTGHTEGHVAFVSDANQLVFTGDHLLPRIHPGLGLGPGLGSDASTLSEYLAGLERVAQLDDFLVCPGHEYTFRGASLRCASTAAHHTRRTDEVRTILREDPSATVWDVAKKVSWTAGWDALHTYRLRSALRQIDMHVSHVLVESPEAGVSS